jgi:hypothetical protein
MVTPGFLAKFEDFYSFFKLTKCIHDKPSILPQCRETLDTFFAAHKPLTQTIDAHNGTHKVGAVTFDNFTYG